MANVTEKTQWNAKVEAWQVHGALTGLAARFEANELDASAVRKAAKALSDLAAEVQAVRDAEAVAKAKYRESVGPMAPEVDQLRKEIEDLKKRLSAR
jgi:phage host-nuclease inhibitor protein Gam